ncbi:splicing regulator SDE2 [Ictalurus punctatus]|uniref:Replication stress response regulator SDE2 n=1 Tax=Ictalurus punctatus TaxID=7998 RepID=A0A2D0Q9P9_ICTPU|nr:splicing regulator SDE2 [Ictalurus punctatus]
MEVFVVSPFSRFIHGTVPHESTVNDLIGLFNPGEGISCVDFYVKNNGRISAGDERLQAGAVYRLEPRLCGGKGGFGSMLRALGAQIEKTTNREACRDLSGRRLRDVNHEKEMAEWLKKQADRDAEKEQRRLERIQRKLAEPRHRFTDTEYERQCHNLSERLEDSVLKGMQASSSGVVRAEEKPLRKRPATKNGNTSSKKKCFWTNLEDLEDVDSSEGESDESEAEASSSSSSSGAGPSCSSRQAAVPTTTTREQEKAESQDRPSSSSSSAGSAPCSPSPSQEKAESQDRPSSSSSNTGSAPCSPSPSQEKAESQDRPSSSSSNTGSAPCSPSPSQEKAESQDRPSSSSSNTGSAPRSPSPSQEKAEKNEEPGQMECSEKEDNTQNVSNQQESEKDRTVETKDCADTQPVYPEEADTPLNLLSVSGVEELEALGLERLKAELMNRGMKCGGTLRERAARLYSVRGLSADQIDPTLLAKPSKGKKK